MLTRGVCSILQDSEKVPDMVSLPTLRFPTARFFESTELRPGAETVNKRMRDSYDVAFYNGGEAAAFVYCFRHGTQVCGRKNQAEKETRPEKGSMFECFFGMPKGAPRSFHLSEAIWFGGFRRWPETFEQELYLYSTD